MANLTRVARLAYEAYRQKKGRRDARGKEIPDWTKQSADFRKEWIFITENVIEQVARLATEPDAPLLPVVEADQGVVHFSPVKTGIKFFPMACGIEEAFFGKLDMITDRWGDVDCIGCQAKRPKDDQS